jgi:hypothetical protein
VYWLIAMQFALNKAREQLARASHIHVTMWNEFFGKGDNLVQANMLAQETRKDNESLEKERKTLMAEDAKVWSVDRMLFWQWLLMLDFWMEKYRLKMSYHMRVSSKGKILQQTRDIDQLFGEVKSPLPTSPPSYFEYDVFLATSRACPHLVPPGLTHRTHSHVLGCLSVRRS